MNLNEIQDIVKDFVNRNNMEASLEIRALDLVSEVGELSKEILKGTKYGKQEFSVTQGWTNEFGDVLYSLICLANIGGVDLENAINTAMDKYKKRFVEKGDMGSGN